MKDKWTNYALLLLSLAVIVAAALYIKSVGFGDMRNGTGLTSGVIPAQTAQAASPPLPSAESAPSGSVTDDKKLSPEQMKADLDYLVQTLEQMHPKLLSGWSDEEKQVIAGAYSNIQQPQTSGEFYFIAGEIVSLLHDGHTYIYSYSAWHLLDLPLYWSQEGLVVTENRGMLRTGDLVTAIGNRSIDELEQELVRVIPAENNQWVRKQGASFVISDMFLNHLGLASNNQAAIQVQRGTQTIEDTLAFRVVSGEDFYNPYPGGNTAVDYYFDRQLSLGVFELRACDYNEHYIQRVRDFFSEVYKQGLQYIAVDLRNNGGGDSRVVDEFLSYLNIDSYLTYGLITRFSPQVNAAYDTGRESGTEEQVPGVTENLIKTVHPFRGKLYILTSPRTFSSANFFAVMVQDNQLGAVLGEATGNQPSSFGDVLSFTLPSSGFDFQVSYKNFTRPDPGRDPAEAVFPDIEAYTTVKDIMARRDTQMDKLREVVQEDLQEKAGE